MTFFISVIAAFFTAIISAITGMGGGITLFSLMTFLFPLQVLIPIHGIVQLVSNFSRTYLLRRHIKRDIFNYFLVGAPIGAFLGAALIQILDKRLPYVLISALIFYVLFKPQKLPQFHAPPILFLPIGIISAALGVVIGPTGPFLAVFFVRDDLDKNQIIATKSSIQIIVHLLKIPTFLYLGFNYLEHIPLLIAMSVTTYLGTLIGIKVLQKIPQKVFLLIFKSVLLIAGLRMLYKAINP